VSSYRYLVPTFDVTWEAIDAALTQLGAVRTETEDGCLMDWELGPDRLHLFQDTTLRLDQIVVEGPGRDELATRIAAAVPTYAADDAPRLFAEVTNDDDLEDKLSILAAVAPVTATPPLVELFRRGFDHASPLVREHAALVATVPAWAELRPHVARLATEDPDAEVRETAAIALRDIDAKQSR